MTIINRSQNLIHEGNELRYASPFRDFCELFPRFSRWRIPLKHPRPDLSAIENLTSGKVLEVANEALQGVQRVVRVAMNAPLHSVPAKDTSIPANEPRLFPSAAVSIIDWVHQSIVNDLTNLASDQSDMEVVDTFLGIRAPGTGKSQTSARSRPLSTLSQRGSRKKDFATSR